MFQWLANLFPSKKPEKFDRTLTQYIQELSQRYYTDDVIVNASTVLGFPPYYRAVALVSSTVAGLPIKVYRAPTREVDETHMGGWTLCHPNPLYGRFSLIRSLVKDLFLYGNGYARINRDSSATPQSLEYLDASRVRLDKVKLLYTYKDETILPENILHMKGLGDPLEGDDPLCIHRESLALGLAMQRYGKFWFNNHVNADIWFSFPSWFKDQEAIGQFRAGLRDKNQGLSKVGEPGILQGGATLQQVNPISNESAQWIQGREQEAITASNVVGCPPHMLGAKISSSYNSFESENRRFLSDLEPVLRSIEEELNLKLLTEVQKLRESHYFEFVREGLLRSDKKTEIELMVDQLNNGILTLRQVLERLNMPVSELGPEADQRRRPANILIEGETQSEQTGNLQQANADQQQQQDN